jgi:hypothetical protein
LQVLQWAIWNNRNKMAIELVYFPPTKPTDIVSNGMTFLHKRAKNFGSADVAHAAGEVAA